MIGCGGSTGHAHAARNARLVVAPAAGVVPVRVATTSSTAARACGVRRFDDGDDIERAWTNLWPRRVPGHASVEKTSGCRPGEEQKHCYHWSSHLVYGVTTRAHSAVKHTQHPLSPAQARRMCVGHQVSRRPVRKITERYTFHFWLLCARKGDGHGRCHHSPASR